MSVTRIVDAQQDVDARLAELRLDQSIISEALRQANLHWVRKTDHHPRLYRHQIMWGETVAALRDLLAPMGWRKSDEGNYELTVNSAGDLAIVIASGDSGTANPNRTPSNKSPKGRHTVDAVAANRQSDMFAELLPVEPSFERSISTWVLLHHRSANKIHVELSKPNEIDKDGMIISWSERLLLSDIPLDGETITVTPPQLPDINIEISRKSA
jgi:hypothetical protein